MSRMMPAHLPPTTGKVVYGVRSAIKDPPGRRRRWFTEHFGEIVGEFGPFAAPLVRRDALNLCTLYVEWRASTYDLEAARRQREDGKGRRASASVIARLQKRSGLLWTDYTAARLRFEELVKHRPVPTIAEYLATRAQHG